MTNISAFSGLLVHLDKQNRPRILDRDDACEASEVARVLASLDALGPSEAGDVIHSLLWRAALAENRAQRFAQELMCLKSGAPEQPDN